MGQRWFVDRHPPRHTCQSCEIFRDRRAARPDAEGWTPKHLTDRRQATKKGGRRIDPFQNLFVVLQDIAPRARRNKIKPRSTLVSTFGEHGIIAWEKPPFALQPTGHLRVWKCRQGTDHADGDAGRLDAIDHVRSNCFGLAVETDDETGHNIHASRIDLVDAFLQAAPCILLLLYGDERVAVGTFDADENCKEICLAHLHQKLGIIGEVDRRFGRSGHARSCLRKSNNVTRGSFRGLLSLTPGPPPCRLPITSPARSKSPTSCCCGRQSPRRRLGGKPWGTAREVPAIITFTAFADGPLSQA